MLPFSEPYAMLAVRAEVPGDRTAVRRVNSAAFGQPDEADLVDRLRARADPYLGLVALEDDAVIGHIVFSPVTFEPPAPQPMPPCRAFGLAPMAVLPDYQRQGVGSALVGAGLDVCRAFDGEAAFGQPDEADLVDRLRLHADPYLGLVALEDDAVIGHIVFSPVTFEPPAPQPMPPCRAFGLAPMAVLPDYQRQGVGSALVGAGLDACRAFGGEGVFVLGHPDYYPRFGFVPASRFGLRCTYDAPDEAFMALPLAPGALDGIAGTVHYHPAFVG